MEPSAPVPDARSTTATPSKQAAPETSQVFKVITSSLPDDLSDTPILQDVVTRSFGSKSLAGAALAAASASAAAAASTATTSPDSQANPNVNTNTDPTPNPELASFSANLRKIRQQNTLEGRNPEGRRSLVGKAMHLPTSEVVGMVSLLEPAAESRPPTALPEIPLASAATRIPPGGQAIVDMWTRSDEQLERKSAEMFGPMWKYEWWYLSALAVVPEFQRRGLGGLLVDWAVGMVRADVEGRRAGGGGGGGAEGKEDVVVGVRGLCLVAADGAIATYQRAGLRFIGEGWLGGDDDDNKRVGDGDAQKQDGKEKIKSRLFTWMILEV